MKKILSVLFFSFLFIGATFASHGIQISSQSYYVGDVSECRYMLQYTCEYGYQKFSDTKGCGCKVGTAITTPHYQTPQQNSTIQSNTYTTGNYYIPQTASSSGSYSCYSDTREVCGAPKNTCTGNNCAILHPRTYTNICQLEAVSATYLSAGKCQTYNRTNYNSYSSQNYKNNYQATDEDYLMYLVENFIYNIERKNYSDKKKIQAIERVITRC